MLKQGKSGSVVAIMRILLRQRTKADAWLPLVSSSPSSERGSRVNLAFMQDAAAPSVTSPFVDN
ncbi:hypothetical protein ACJRO7_017995 [Eucalyptus globulus]|uniref:Uncharacterized protein n=1 Tax=Eucalyptus globulus TaxID=34317 RepID=A0ABD3KS43_EUCGL